MNWIFFGLISSFLNSSLTLAAGYSYQRGSNSLKNAVTLGKKSIVGHKLGTFIGKGYTRALYMDTRQGKHAKGWTSDVRGKGSQFSHEKLTFENAEGFHQAFEAMVRDKVLPTVDGRDISGSGSYTVSRNLDLSFVNSRVGIDTDVSKQVSTARFQVDLIARFENGKYTEAHYNMHGYPLARTQAQIVHAGPLR